ncbi:MAG: PKD domain-containing protein, partial [Thermoplasmata archaeon]
TVCRNQRIILGANETVTFDASLSFDPDNDELNCTWNFGDGTNAHGMSVEHSYTPAEVYRDSHSKRR